MKTPQSWSWILLLTTSGTLLCCAIPIILVMLGLGATVATMAAWLPWLITLSHYKEWVFLGSAVLIALALWSVYRPGRSCPIDPELALVCVEADRWNRVVIILSGAMWIVGALAAYVLPLLQ
jgi:hypothetical protein